MCELQMTKGPSAVASSGYSVSVVNVNVIIVVVIVTSGPRLSKTRSDSYMPNESTPMGKLAT